MSRNEMNLRVEVLFLFHFVSNISTQPRLFYHFFYLTRDGFDATTVQQSASAQHYIAGVTDLFAGLHSCVQRHLWCHLDLNIYQVMPGQPNDVTCYSP